MYQGLGLAIASVMPQAIATGLLEAATCTIAARPDTVSATGQPNLSAFVAITDLTDLQCMLAIQRPALPNQSATARMPQQFDTQTQYHLLLQGYYPAIEQENQAQVTLVSTGQTTAYEIMAVESDSQANMTRLALREYTL